MFKILLLGDTHANRMAMHLALYEAEYRRVDAIVQVGDFGYWPRMSGGQNFLKEASKQAKRLNIPIYWVDGNHEDFQELHRLAGPRPDHMVKVRDNIYWLPRGYSWEWEGVSFLAMGGAASIDRKTRTLGRTWFLEEMINDEDVEQAQPADIVISHDAPFLPIKNAVAMEDSEFCRQQIRRVVNTAQPDLLVHGHYHMYHDTPALREGGYVRVLGLGCDHDPDNMAILTLDNGKWELTPLPPYGTV